MISLVQDLSSSIGVSQPSPLQIIIDAEPVPRGIAGSVSVVTEKDHVFNETTGTTTWSDYVVSGGTLDQDIQLVNHTPEIATLDGEGNIEWVSNGLCRVSATRDGASKTRFLNCYKSTGTTLKVFINYATGSLAETLAAAVLERVEEVGATAPYYTGIDHSSAAYTKSATCWAADLDLSCLPVATTLVTAEFGPQNRGALVTARHAVLASHYIAGSPVGKKLRFRSPAGTIYEKTITGSASFSDLTLVTLDSNVNGSITPISVVGEWWMRDKVNVSADTENGYYAGLACFMDQTLSMRFLLVGNYRTAVGQSLLPATINGTQYLAPITGTAISRGTMSSAGTPAFLSGKTTFYQEGIKGDSGSAVFVILDGAPGLLWTWWNHTSGVPVWTDGLLDDLIAAADANAGVSTGLTVTIIPPPSP